VINFRLLVFSIVSGAVSGKGVGCYGGKSTGIFSFVFTILCASYHRQRVAEPVATLRSNMLAPKSF